MTKLTTTQAADLAKVTVAAITHACRTGKLRATKHGQAWAIDEENLRAWMAKRRRGRPPKGLISHHQAGEMLGGKHKATIGWYIWKGNLLEFITPTAIVTFALIDRAEEMSVVVDDEDYLAGVAGDRDYYILYPGERPVSFGRFDALLSAMKEIALLTQWRVKKG